MQAMRPAFFMYKAQSTSEVIGLAKNLVVVGWGEVIAVLFQPGLPRRNIFRQIVPITKIVIRVF